MFNQKGSQVNISGFGFLLQLIASNTFPTGFTLSEFADDTDPFDLPSVKIADTAMGLNGTIEVWNNAVIIPISISVIPMSQEDINLAILFSLNKVSFGQQGARDEITLIGYYPNGNIVTAIGGYMTDGMAANSVSSAGRLKTKTYTFNFADVI